MKKILFFVVLIFICFTGCDNQKPLPIERVRTLYPTCRIVELSKDARKFVVICPDNKVWYVETMNIWNNQITHVRKVEEIFDK